MKKILVGKGETTASVAEKIIAEEDTDIVLVVPKGAALKTSVSNFHLLRREAKEAGKNVFIESVDEETLALAHAAQLEATHPLFRSDANRSFSDIRPQQSEEKPTARRVAKGVLSKKTKEVISEKEVTPDVDETQEHMVTLPIVQSSVQEERRRRRFMPGKRWIQVAVVVVLLATGAWWVTSTVFGKATIAIGFRSLPAEHEGEFRALKTARRLDAAGSVLPAQVFTERKNHTQLFPASGRAEVAQKATGKLVIYNAYNSSPQTLVATTRFVAPDGKVFRLDRQITVPGARVENGKIIPSSIEASVTADKAGADYNMAAVARLSIPGFSGSPRYEGFYGALPEGVAGGFIGERAVPTEADITAAKEKMKTILETSVKSDILSGRPEGITIIDGASETSIAKLTVNNATDSKGNFSVLGEVQFKAVGFKEEDLKGILKERVSGGDDTLVFKELSLEYRNVKVDYDRGELSFSVRGKGTLGPIFDEPAFRDRVAGKLLGEARSMISELPHLEEAKISVWPVWLSRLPSRSSRIQIVVE